MFEDLNIHQKQMVFQSLKFMVESAQGIGFHNKDQGHSYYATGDLDAFPDGDGPNKNDLFQMLSGLSREMKANNDTGYIWWYDFSEWTDFCQFAYGAYRKKKSTEQ